MAGIDNWQELQQSQTCNVPPSACLCLCRPPPPPPVQVDSAILAHPGVAEAVCFAAPDEKYGEVVAAAVVLNEQGKGMADIGGLGVPASAACCWLSAAAGCQAARLACLPHHSALDCHL